MTKTVGFFLLWVVGCAAAVAVAWAGVSIVDDELVSPAPANSIAVTSAITPGAATEVTDTTPDDATVSSEPSPTEETDPVTDVETASPDDDSEAEATPPTTAPGSNGPRTTSAPNPPPPPTPPPTPTTTASAPTTTTAPPPPPAQAQTITFNLVGGSTAILFAPGSITMLWATPNPGFDVENAPEDTGWTVRFTADHHRSRIDAWWLDGPQHEIREIPKD